MRNHILIAPNAFKNSLDASSVAEAIGEGLHQSRLSFSCEFFPVGDGGDGTAFLLRKRWNATAVNSMVNDPLGRKIPSSIGLTPDGHTAIIELADASGLRLLRPEEYDPLSATTYGTGELLRLALDRGVRHVILGIGGSATVDAGLGILAGLGLRFLDTSGHPMEPLPGLLPQLGYIDDSGFDKRMLGMELTVLCDVENPLLGENGTVAVFSEQKGAGKGIREELEAGLQQLNRIVFEKTGKEMSDIRYGGAAGGTAAGLWAFANARLVNGIDFFLDGSGFDHALEKATLVITAEGSMDTQTLAGKGPAGVARRAKQRAVPVIGLAGKVPAIPAPEWDRYFEVLLPIGQGPVPLDQAVKFTRSDLIRTARSIGNLLCLF